MTGPKQRALAFEEKLLAEDDPEDEALNDDWQVYGDATATARWLASDASPASAPFSIAGWTDQAPLTAALAGGVIAVAEQPESGSTTRRWRGTDRSAPARCRPGRADRRTSRT